MKRIFEELEKKDAQGKVSLNEFADSYVKIKNEYLASEKEIKQEITDS